MAKKVLIIDDDQYLRELYEEVLQKEGYEVFTAVDGKLGYEQLTAQVFDAVLLDIMLPQLDGIGVLTKLKESVSAVDFKHIIVLSSLSHDAAVQQAASMGVYATLTKSEITPDQLIAKVKEMLGETAPAAVAAAPAASVATPPTTSTPAPQK